MPNHIHKLRAGWPRGDNTPSGIDVIEYDQYNENRGFVNDALCTALMENTGGGDSHSHGITTSAHNHTVKVGSISTYQPYKALYKVMRVA